MKKNGFAHIVQINKAIDVTESKTGFRKKGAKN